MTGRGARRIRGEGGPARSGRSWRRGPRRAEGRRRPATPWIVLALSVLLAGLIGGVGHALWWPTASIPGSDVTAGDLVLTTGDVSWQQVTPGVTSPAHGLLDTTPTDFFSMPGDVVEITVPVTTFLKGDNLAGALSVAYADPGSADPTITAVFHVEDESGQQVAPASGEASLGDAVPVPGLIGDDAGVTAHWTVVVTVSVGGDFSWSSAPASASPKTTWDAGTIAVDLVQARTGGGFADPSTPGGRAP